MNSTENMQEVNRDGLSKTALEFKKMETTIIYA